MKKTVYTFFIFPLLPHLRMSLQAWTQEQSEPESRWSYSLKCYVAFFSALCLMMKLPNPRRNTSFPAIIDSLTLSMNASTTVVATDFSIPVSCAIRAIISAFVRLFYYKIRCKDNNISLCRLDCQPDNVTENDNPPLSHGVPSARTRQSESRR